MASIDSAKLVKMGYWLKFLLMLWSGIQIAMAFYYAYMIAGGMGPVWEYRLKGNFKIWLYGVQSLFIDGLLYHALAKTMLAGTSGFKLQYFAIIVNLNQICAASCFFKSMFAYSPKDGFVYVQIFIYIPTFIFGCLMTAYAWKTPEHTEYTEKGSFLYYRRRDWGLASVLSSACLFMITFINSHQESDPHAPNPYGKYAGLYGNALTLMCATSILYHFFGLKVAKGNWKRHRILSVVCLIFIALTIIGLAMYIYATEHANAYNMLYYIIIIISLINIMSGLGNGYISWRPFNDDLEYYLKDGKTEVKIESLSEDENENEEVKDSNPESSDSKSLP